MSRSSVQVTRVVSGDDEELASLWRASRAAEGRSEESTDRALRDGRLERACARPDVRIFLARVDDEPVGFTVVMVAPASAMHETRAVWVDLLWVKPGRRQRGVASVLLHAVATYADQISASEVISCVPTGSRDANRFFARLGFASVVTERSTTPGALHRRLAREHRPSSVAEAVRRRRSERARSRTAVTASVPD